MSCTLYTLCMAGYTPFMTFWGRFGAFWSPPMAISDPKNGSYTSARMFPAEIQPWSTQYNQFGDTRGASGRIYLIYSILRPFLAIKIVQKTKKKSAPLGSPFTSTIGTTWNHWFTLLTHFFWTPPLKHTVPSLSHMSLIQGSASGLFIWHERDGLVQT